MHSKERFGSQTAAVMALAGSAIGLGNIWRFPYMMGEYGGAVFIIVYIICSLFLAVPLMVAESVIGRSTRKGPLGAIHELAPGSRWIWVGRFCMIAPLVIMSYYSVVGGWSFDYLIRSLSGHMGTQSIADASSLFGRVSSRKWEPVLAHTVFLGFSALILLGGVKGGIERFSKYTVPMLFALMLFLVAYSLNLPGSGEGVKYLLKPDFSKVSGDMLVAAMGQAFFSMSIGMGVVITYSSYMRRDSSLLSTAVATSLSDTGFALISGFAIMPAVFAAGLQPEAGPSLVFETLPFIFSKMQEISPVLSIIVPVAFFLSILIAALTSEISLLEVCVEYLQERKRLSRRNSVLLVFLISWLLGILCAVRSDIFEICDKVSSDFLIVLGALAFSLFVGWKMEKKKVEKEIDSRLFNFIYFVIRYIAPVAIASILITNIFV